MLWDKIFFIGLTIVGLGIGAYIIYTGWKSVENPPVSSVLFFCTTILQFIFTCCQRSSLRPSLRSYSIGNWKTDLEINSTVWYLKMTSPTELAGITGTTRSKSEATASDRSIGRPMTQRMLTQMKMVYILCPHSQLTPRTSPMPSCTMGTL